MASKLKSLIRRWDLAVVIILLLFAIFEGFCQLRERAYVRDVTHQVLAEANATSPKERALALRNYLRNNIQFQGAEVDGRPFLRSTAAETLASGKGYCGEVSRVFICMARVADLRAQRVNLYGPQPHVVAEVELPETGSWIVDCQNPPPIPDLMRLDHLLMNGEYNDYSTLNVRRLGIGWLFSRVKMQMGPITYWGENPHALKAASYTILAVGVLLLRPMRWSIRAILRKRGWVHVTDQVSLEMALIHRKPAAHSVLTSDRAEEHLVS